MPNMLQNGATWLGRKLQAHAWRSVSIIQGTTVLDGITAVLAMVEHDVVDQQDFTTKVMSFDWTIVAADLVTNGQPLEMRNGTLIVEKLNGTTTHYEAMPIGKKPCVEPKDTSGILLVLHTKKVLCE